MAQVCVTKAWRTIRTAVIRTQGCVCATTDCHRGEPLCVVPLDGTPNAWRALCRSCYMRETAPTRMPRAWRTRLLQKLAQMPIGLEWPHGQPVTSRGLGPPYCPACNAHDARVLSRSASKLRCVECGEVWAGSPDELADAAAQERRRRRRSASDHPVLLNLDIA